MKDCSDFIDRQKQIVGIRGRYPCYRGGFCLSFRQEYNDKVDIDERYVL